MLKGVAQLLLKRTLFNNEPCEDTSNIVSIDHCEKLRTTLGSNNIDMANTAYQNLLKEIEADITAFEGTLHQDPKIHNAMLVDYIINQKMAYKKDIDIFGKDDVWADPTITAATMQGDCEDYTLLKLKVLMDLKIISPGEGYIGYIEDQQENGHAILVITDSNGKPYVLDNYEATEETPIEPTATPLEEYQQENISTFFSIYDGHNIYKNTDLENRGTPNLTPNQTLEPKL